MPSNNDSPTSLRDSERIVRAPQACKRCFTRKRKCDRLYPKCSACAEAGLDCEPGLKVEDQSLVSQLHACEKLNEELKDRVRFLENQLGALDIVVNGVADVTPALYRASGATSLPSDSQDTPGAPMTQTTSDSNVSISDLISMIQSDGTDDVPCSINASASTSSYQQIPSASRHLLFPPLEIALTFIGRFFFSLSQSLRCVDEAEIERDMRLIYGFDGLLSPALAPNRFRACAVIAIADKSGRGAEDGVYNTELGHWCWRMAMKELPGLVCQADITAVQALALMSVGATYETGGMGLGQLIGFAARCAFAINLHRRDDVYLTVLVTGAWDEALIKQHNEKRKNIFWAIYCLDRLAGFANGLPFSIRDQDIDVALPDVPEASTGGWKDTFDRRNVYRHNIQLRQLYGKIQDQVYPVNPACSPVEHRLELASQITGEVEEWHYASPYRSAFYPLSQASMVRQATNDLSYHQMILAIHRPSALLPEVPSSFIIKLRSSATTSVALYSHYWSQKQVLMNSGHLYHAFLACTALIYSLAEHRSRPDLIEIPFDEVQSCVCQCQDLLTRFGSLWPQTRGYRSMFDTLVDSYQSTGSLDALAPTPWLDPFQATDVALNELSLPVFD